MFTFAACELVAKTFVAFGLVDLPSHTDSFGPSSIFVDPQIGVASKFGQSLCCSLFLNNCLLKVLIKAKMLDLDLNDAICVFGY